MTCTENDLVQCNVMECCIAQVHRRDHQPPQHEEEEEEIYWLLVTMTTTDLELDISLNDLWKLIPNSKHLLCIVNYRIYELALGLSVLNV